MATTKPPAAQVAKATHGYIGDKDRYLARLKRIEGQARGIHRMIDEDTYCIDILTQISALTTEINTLLGQQGGAGGTTTGKSSVAVPSQAGVNSEQSMTQRLSKLFR